MPTPRATIVPDAEQDHYRRRFLEADSPAALVALLHELGAKYPGDPYAMSLGEEIATAVAMEAPELLEEL